MCVCEKESEFQTHTHTVYTVNKWREYISFFNFNIDRGELFVVEPAEGGEAQVS